MPLGRGSHNVVYNKMGKSKYASMPTPFQVIKGMAKRQSASLLRGFQNVMVKVDKKMRKKMGLPYGH